jgi:hypothetical protein
MSIGVAHYPTTKDIDFMSYLIKATSLNALLANIMYNDFYFF